VISNWLRLSIAGLTGGLAWCIDLSVIFGAARGILSNPNLKSQKMIAAFTDTRARCCWLAGVEQRLSRFGSKSLL
jgi:hypothetical protein